MIPTFTLSKNDLAYLLFRTLAISSLRQLQGWHVHVSLLFPFLTIGEHRWLQRQETRNHQNREFAVHGHAREAFGYWVLRSTTMAAMRLGMHAGVFFFKVHLAGGTRFREVSSSRHRLMGLHLRGSATILWWAIFRRETYGEWRTTCVIAEDVHMSGVAFLSVQMECSRTGRGGST
jgi:hypothetical protein